MDRIICSYYISNSITINSLLHAQPWIIHNTSRSTLTSKMFAYILPVCTRQFNISWYLDFTVNETGVVSTNARKICMIIDILWMTQSSSIGCITKWSPSWHITKFKGRSGGGRAINFSRKLLVATSAFLDTIIYSGALQ